MDKYNKYYINLKRAIVLIVIYFIGGTVIAIIKNYNYVNPNLFYSIESVIRLVRTFSILGFLFIIGYLGYKGYSYSISRFYKETNIPLNDAFTNSFIDMAYVYDRVRRITTVERVEIDKRNKLLLVKTKQRFYSVMIRDYAGKVEAKIDSESWYIVSKKKKEFGQITYKKKVRISNPFKDNERYIASLKKPGDYKVENVVCLTSFRKSEINSNQVVQSFELLEIIENEVKF